MAEAAQEIAPTLTEQWSLQDKEDRSDNSEVLIEKPVEDEKPADASPEEVVIIQNDETPIPGETNPIVEENSETPESKGAEEVPETNATNPIVEKKSETTELKEAEEVPPETNATDPVDEDGGAVEQDDAEQPEIKLETAPADFRFPTTNQTRHCFTRYIEYHRCVAAKGEGEGAPECDKFAKYYRSLCPSEWIERWNEQRASGTFPGPL